MWVKWGQVGSIDVGLVILFKVGLRGRLGEKLMKSEDEMLGE